MDRDSKRWADATRRHLDVLGKTPGRVTELLRWPGSWMSGLLNDSLIRPLSRGLKEDLFRQFGAHTAYERRGPALDDLSHFSDDELLEFYEGFDPRPAEIDLEGS